jgi:hypothetical protein
LIYIHIELETGEEAVGIIQMSAIAHDNTTNSRFGTPFNMYVKPPPHIKAKHWRSQAERSMVSPTIVTRSRMLNPLLKYEPSLWTCVRVLSQLAKLVALLFGTARALI